MLIYSAENRQEALLIVGLLQQTGIEVTLKNENLQGAIGEIPFTHAYPELYLLDERDETLARKIITEYESSREYLKTIICPACGEENPANFPSCWACEASLEK
ncbi:MAG: DUF2007 domain-containing protein [Gammaproteobacteria bacterium]|nr:DUF2007 domain-containing protein [Gammaproteobacteria bacterium]